MERIIEWALATIGALICVVGAMLFWQSQAATPVGLMPTLPLLEMALLGLAGLVAIALDSEERTWRWGIITWVICGGLTALMLLGAFSLGPVLLPAVLIFAGAAILADRRRKRKILTGIGVYTVSAIANFTLLFIFIVVAR